MKFGVPHGPEKPKTLWRIRVWKAHASMTLEHVCWPPSQAITEVFQVRNPIFAIWDWDRNGDGFGSDREVQQSEPIHHGIAYSYGMPCIPSDNST